MQPANVLAGIGRIYHDRRRVLTRLSGRSPFVELGLPPTISACLFDLDGVLTQTAKVHAQAWKQTFDEFLRTQPGQAPFDLVGDYDQYVDGKPREDGVRSFLDSRRIAFDVKLVQEIAMHKDATFLDLIHANGVERYDGSIQYLEAVRHAGIKTAVVSSSKNTTEVLRAAGITGFDAQVDGNVAEEEHLHGKPAPDTYLQAARMLDLEAARCAVFEDALAGVEAGRAGHFGHVVGVDRAGQKDALYQHGADVVVEGLEELLGRTA
jgi:beta-phosphoglucomutase family hydrolase